MGRKKNQKAKASGKIPSRGSGVTKKKKDGVTKAGGKSAKTKKTPSRARGVTKTGGKPAGARGIVTKNYLSGGSTMQVKEENNTMDVEYGGGQPDIIKNKLEDGSTMRGTIKNDRFRVKRKLTNEQNPSEKQSKTDSETCSSLRSSQGLDKQEEGPSTSRAETAKSSFDPTSNTQSEPKVESRSKAATSKLDEYVTITIKSLVTSSIKRQRFKQTEKLTAIWDVIGGNQGEYGLFDASKTRLAENKSFKENGIKTDDVIMVTKEQYAHTGSVPFQASHAQ